MHYISTTNIKIDKSRGLIPILVYVLVFDILVLSLDIVLEYILDLIVITVFVLVLAELCRNNIIYAHRI